MPRSDGPWTGFCIAYNILLLSLENLPDAEAGLMRGFPGKAGGGGAPWLSVAVHGDRIDLAQVQLQAGARPAVRMCDSVPRTGTDLETLGRVRRSVQPRSVRLSHLLGTGQYQMQMVEAPGVPRQELKQAVRWKLKDLLDYPVDAATVDVADIPTDPAGAARGHFVYAVSARNEQIAARMKLFHDARLPLQAIDVPEMAQRNIARLFEEPNRGLALLAFDERGAMLTFTSGGEMYMSRYTDITVGQLASPASATREQSLERLVLELQRSIDHFDRQFSYVTLSRLLVAPVPVDALEQHLADNLYLPVQTLDLSQVLELSGVPGLRDPMQQSARLHLLGAALRTEPVG
jgi:MSHA biogenesis protein MshI